jgi:pyridoxamine 5'-phosphate oxidase
VADAWLDGLDADPWAVLGAWLGEARAAGLLEPDGAALATSTREGHPSVRMVLVRGVDDGDLRFYTNHESRKAGELGANPRAALCFYWGLPLRRQVRVEGSVERLSDEESLGYFRRRPRESRLGAWASLYASAEERFAGIDEVPLPEWWGGYRVVPDAFELWQNRESRLHDRARYERSGDGWSRARLGP